MLLIFSQKEDESAEETLERFFAPEHYATLAEEDPVFTETPDEKQTAYIRAVTEQAAARRAEIDALIERYARGWKPERLSRAAAAILRCAMCEILFLPEVPPAVAINEAVEIAKKYEDAETVAFVNGVLGGFVRGEGLAAPEPDGSAGA